MLQIQWAESGHRGMVRRRGGDTEHVTCHLVRHRLAIKSDWLAFDYRDSDCDTASPGLSFFAGAGVAVPGPIIDDSLQVMSWYLIAACFLFSNLKSSTLVVELSMI